MKKKYNRPYLKQDLYYLNNKLPINLGGLEKIINSVHARYPILSKTEISLIVKALFEELREQLVHGNTINLLNIGSGIRIHTYCKLYSTKLVGNVRVQVNTPPGLKR